MKIVITALLFLSSLGLSPSALAQDEDTPAVTYARIQTSMGNIDVALNREKAPITTANFLEYATSGFYDRLIIHRVVQGVLIQGGGYSSGFLPRATRDPIANEASNGLKNVRGTIAMARYDDPDSATSQFFINLQDNDFLDRTGDEFKKDAGYTVFGEVVDGMDVADAIGAVATSSGGRGDVYFDAELPVDTITILRVDPINEEDIGQ